MNKIAKKVIIGGALLVLGFALFEKFNAATSMSFSISNVQLGNVVVGQPLPLIITFDLTNSTDSSLTINNATGSFYINGVYVGSLPANAIQSTTIAAKSSQPLQLQININVSNLLTSFDVGGQDSLTLTYTGNVEIENVSFPVSINKMFNA